VERNHRQLMSGIRPCPFATILAWRSAVNRPLLAKLLPGLLAVNPADTFRVETFAPSESVNPDKTCATPFNGAVSTAMNKASSAYEAGDGRGRASLHRCRSRSYPHGSPAARHDHACHAATHAGQNPFVANRIVTDTRCFIRCAPVCFAIAGLTRFI
jgi:hypothetical protein